MEKRRRPQQISTQPSTPPQNQQPLVTLLLESPAYKGDSLSVIPQYVADAAKQLKKAKSATALKKLGYEFNDPILPFLRALNTGPETLALTTLARLLQNYPALLRHDFVWSIVLSLSRKPTPHDELWMHELMKAWVEGMTFGENTVVQRKPSKLPRSGRPPALFPQLKEQHGWLRSKSSDNANASARGLLRDYVQLHEELKTAVQWKVESRAYREWPEGAIRRVASEIEGAFTAFKKQRNYSSSALSVQEYDQIVRDGFVDIAKGHGGRHWVTCSLLATLGHIGALNPSVAVTPSIIHKTVATLQKHFGDWYQMLVSTSQQAKKRNAMSSREVKTTLYRVLPPSSKNPSSRRKR